jgi:hypothetical protein
MASKTLSDEKPGSQPRRTAAVELRVSGEAQPSAMALLPPNIPPFYEDSRLRHLQTDLLGSENYQVALVPPANARTSIQGRRV